jgi:hypothetical protein
MNGEDRRQDREDADLAEIKLFVPEDLYRAFQRCVWIQVNETGRDQRDIMREVVHDFLVKHGC